MSEPTPLDDFEPIDDLELPVSLPPNRSTPVVIVDKAKYLAMQQRIEELEQQLEDDHVAATIQLQALTIERDDARQRIQELEAELAETYGECIEFVVSYGLGSEERYRTRYRELTGKEWDNNEQ